MTGASLAGLLIAESFRKKMFPPGRPLLIHGILWVAIFLLCGNTAISQTDVEGVQFFERNIRPVLVETLLQVSLDWRQAGPGRSVPGYSSVSTRRG